MFRVDNIEVRLVKTTDPLGLFPFKKRCPSSMGTKPTKVAMRRAKSGGNPARATSGGLDLLQGRSFIMHRLWSPANKRRKLVRTPDYVNNQSPTIVSLSRQETSPLASVQAQNGKRIDRIGMWFVGWNEVVAISNPPRGFDEPQPMWALD